MPYRTPIDPFIRSQPYEQFVAHPHPEAMKVTFRHMLEAVRTPLEAELAFLKGKYREATDAHAELEHYAKRIQANNMSWDGLGDDFASAFQNASAREYGALMQCELFAEHILLTLDSLMTTLVRELTGADRPTEIGVQLANDGDVRIDRLLDAAGNFIRHRSEWRSRLHLGDPLSEGQTRSIEALGRALANDATLTTRRAGEYLMGQPQPMLAVLDIIGDYAVHGENLDYAVIHSRCLKLGYAMIEGQFAQWYVRRRRG